MTSISPLQNARLHYLPKLPNELQNFAALVAAPAQENTVRKTIDPQINAFFPNTHHLAFLKFVTGSPTKHPTKHPTKKVGVVLSGGQAPGGHNVITGLYDALKKLNNDNQLFGFLNGPSGIVNNQFIEITSETLKLYRNQGGFDLIGSGRTKIDTAQQLKSAEQTVRALDLDGLVIIGGDDSNTNAAHLAEYFKSNGCKTSVVGVPKTIDGDLKNDDIEVSFGFDTASKIYSEIISNIARDALSAKKAYYFIKMMGRSASHITLECALQTHPNLALISEEVAKGEKTLEEVVKQIADMICKRAEVNKDYGVILIPEGIIEFIPEFNTLIQEINTVLAQDSPYFVKINALETKEEKIAYVATILSLKSSHCFQMIPQEIQSQLLMDRDPHGNVQVSKIETERLFIDIVKKELNSRKDKGLYKGKFSGQPHFCGYEGRSGMPTNFDAQYCYALGHVAALLINVQANGYIACVQNLASPVDEWHIGGRPLVSMMQLEERFGKAKPVIAKALVKLDGRPFKNFAAMRSDWAIDDDYIFTGPIQFFGSADLTDHVTFTLAYESNDATVSVER